MPRPGRPPRPRPARSTAPRIWDHARSAPPLKKLSDQGGETTLAPEELGLQPRPDWTDSFLAANQPELSRLSITTTIRAHYDRTLLLLTAGDKLGAIPLRSPVTRKVAAGLLVQPRFGWSSVGHVLAEVGFRVEPEIGGLALVPGSAREVPPWVLAAPVLSRIAALLTHLSRAFTPVTAGRTLPRGTVDWNHYAARSLPTGRWTSFLCSYSELSHDPHLLGALRWSLHRIAQDLESSTDPWLTARLTERIATLLQALGPGPSIRPSANQFQPSTLQSDWLRLATEAIAWVRDERGLGGARSLDGLPWSLPVNSLWEAWVEAFLSTLAQRLGARLFTARQGATLRPFLWRSSIHSMGHLAPDFLLQLPGRSVWIDAKYKDHLNRLQAQPWPDLPLSLREAHRADLHQALAYAALSDSPIVDTLLLYPSPDPTLPDPPFALADLAAGSRHLRLALASLPFAFQGPAHREQTLAAWTTLLRPAA